VVVPLRYRPVPAHALLEGDQHRHRSRTTEVCRQI